MKTCIISSYAIECTDNIYSHFMLIELLEIMTFFSLQLSIMRQVTANNFRPPQQLNMRQITFFYWW